MSDKIKGALFIALLAALVICVAGLRYNDLRASVADGPTFYPATFCVEGYLFVGVRMGGNGVDIEQVFERGYPPQPIKCK